MARFFIDRPIFAWVVSLGILLAGFISLRALPIEQYPEVAPPSLAISVVYPGADAATLETNVTQVIEPQLNEEGHARAALVGLRSAIDDLESLARTNLAPAGSARPARRDGRSSDLGVSGSESGSESGSRYFRGLSRPD